MRAASDDEQGWDTRPGLLQGLRRHWRLVVPVVLLGMVAGYVLSSLQPTQYTATAQIVLRSPSAPGVLGENPTFVNPERHLVNQAQRLTSRDVMEEAAQDLGDVDVRRLRFAVEVTPSLDTDAITIRARAGDAQRAADIANSVVDAYERIMRRESMRAARRTVAELESAVEDARQRLTELEEQLDDDPGNPVYQGQIAAQIQQLGTLETRIEQVSVNASLRGSGVEYVEPAEAPRGRSRPRPKRSAAAGGLLALLCATGLTWVVEGRRRQADQVGDPAAVLNAPLLGAVPTFDQVGVEDDVPTISAPRSAAAEAYHLAALSMLASLPEDEDEGSVILVTSAEPGDGKTVSALNLAIASGFGDRGVVLLDADARMRGLSRTTGRQTDPGLKELHEAEDVLSWYEYRYDLDGAEGIEVVPAGGDVAEPTALFQSPGFARVVQRLRDHAGLVIIDSPPLLAVADSVAIAQHVDGIILVVKQGAPLSGLEEVRRQLAFVEAPLLGYIVNRTNLRNAPYASYGYEPIQEKT